MRPCRPCYTRNGSSCTDIARCPVWQELILCILLPWRFCALLHLSKQDCQPHRCFTTHADTVLHSLTVPDSTPPLSVSQRNASPCRKETCGIVAMELDHQLNLFPGCTCRFFVYWLMLFLIHNMAICLFRAIGALSRDLVVANACGSLALLTIMLMGGFVIPKSSVHPWVVWLYWIDPLQWAQRAITINEFSASRWGPLGPAILQIRAFPNHYWCVPPTFRKWQAWLDD